MQSKIKKIILILVLVIVVASSVNPSVAMASWWNPFTWNIFSIFNRSSQPSEIEKLRSEIADLKKQISSTIVDDKSKTATKPIAAAVKAPGSASQPKKQDPQQGKSLVSENKTQLAEASKLPSNKNINGQNIIIPKPSIPSPKTYTPPTITTPALTPTPPPVVILIPTAILSVNPSVDTEGSQFVLNWSSNNATSCSAPWTSSQSTTGSQAVFPTQTTNYSITCNGNGGSAKGSITATVVSLSQPTSFFSYDDLGGGGLGSGISSQETPKVILLSSKNPNGQKLKSGVTAILEVMGTIKEEGEVEVVTPLPEARTYQLDPDGYSFNLTGFSYNPDRSSPVIYRLQINLSYPIGTKTITNKILENLNGYIMIP